MPMPDQNRSAFRERLGMYLLGIAIGFVILGLIFTMRKQAARRQTPDGTPNSASSPSPRTPQAP